MFTAVWGFVLMGPARPPRSRLAARVADRPTVTARRGPIRLERDPRIRSKTLGPLKES